MAATANQWLRRLLSSLIHRYIAVSQDLARWLVSTVRIAPGKVTHIYNGVDGSRFLPRFAVDGGITSLQLRAAPPGIPPGFLPDTGCCVIGTVGRLAAVKDQQSLIRALAHIFQQSTQYRQTLRCILVGDGPEHAARDQVRTRGQYHEDE